MPIEVPDTRAFSEPPRPRRKRPQSGGSTPAAAGADSLDEAITQATAELVAAGAGVAASEQPSPPPADGSAFSKPVRRRKPAASGPIEAASVATDDAPVAESAFSKPVRRRKPIAPEPAAVVADAVDAPAPAGGEAAPVAESAFSKPVRRRKPLAPEPAAVVADAIDAPAPAGGEAAPVTGSAFSKPVRRRKPLAPEPVGEVTGEVAVEVAVDVAADVAAEIVDAAPQADSAFSRPVRRRPRTSPEAVPASAPIAADEAPDGADVGPASVEPSPESPIAGASVLVPAADSVSAAALPDVDPAAATPAPVPEQARPDRHAHAADERPVSADVDRVPEVTDTVVVRLAGTRYAVAMDAVAEVGRPPHVTRVPGVPAWIAGVANWRGRIMPVLDLRVLLGAPTVELSVSGRIMVLSRDGLTLAFLAERVEGVVGLELDRLEPVLLTLSRSTASVLSGQLAHPDGPIALLDLDMIFALRSQLPRVRRAG